MYLKLPLDYVDPATQTPLPDAVLSIADLDLRWVRGDTRLTARIYNSAEVVGRAAPISEYMIVLSLDERSTEAAQIQTAFYTIVAARPEYVGSIVVGQPGPPGSAQPISNVVITPTPGAGTCDISWDTIVPADSLVEYGQTLEYGKFKRDTAEVEHHTLSLTGLASGIMYHYAITSKTGGYVAQTADATFTQT